MESVNQTITDALLFIGDIQDLFAKKRQLIEALSLHEYDKFVKEWKQEQKKIVKPFTKEIESTQVKQVEDKQITIEVEQLALVDALLEKARNIRMKNKELLKESKHCMNKPQLFVESSSKSSKVEVQHKIRLNKNSKELSGDKTVVPRSKSVLISSTVKTAVVPRSKSSNAYQVTKDIEKLPKKIEAVSKQNCIKNVCLNKSKEQRTFDVHNSAVLSNKDLKDYKKLLSDHNDWDRKTNDKILCTENFYTPLSSDCFQFSNYQGCFPTYRRFQKELKRTSLSKSCFNMHPGVLWYPYLSSENKNYLCSLKKFDSWDSFKKSVDILHKIQETMVWIDIINFVGKALSKLQLMDKNDESVAQICSYLGSICHKDFQRAPLLELC